MPSVSGSLLTPAPKDDFDLDAVDDAKQYKDDQELEMARQKVRDENKQRRLKGLKPLKLPQKPKGGSARSSRPRDSRSASGESDDDMDSLDSDNDILKHTTDPRELRYEGRKVLEKDSG